MCGISDFFIISYWYCFTGIRKYIVALIIKTSSDPAFAEREKVYLGKLNMILVQVNKRINVIMCLCMLI